MEMIILVEIMLSAINFSSTIPQILENSQNLDFYFLLMQQMFGVLIMISLDDK